VTIAVETNEKEPRDRTVLTLRHNVWLTGILGMLYMIVTSIPLPLNSFDIGDFSPQIAFLGTTVLLSLEITSG